MANQAHVRVADRFKKQSAEQLVTMAGAIITGLTNNPSFPALTNCHAGPVSMWNWFLYKNYFLIDKKVLSYPAGWR